MRKIIFCIIAILLWSCGTYQITPVDKCCETEVVYLDEIKNDSVNLFTSLDFNTITLDFRPLRPRFHWGHNYGYWGHRPLWLDFDFYYGYSNYYSYYYRPWNHWDWYMRPVNSWYQGPFNNQSYNVIYNASRRGSLTSISNTIKVNRNKPRVNIDKPVVNNFIANYKPNNNNNTNIRVKPNNNWQPSNNNIIVKPSNNYSRPSNNSVKPSNNYSRPSSNVISRPSSSPSRGGKNPR
tara:strand:- start:459 stop:1166 length:708 start_codon:yes stop_codon:yes gene_type:complete